MKTTQSKRKACWDDEITVVTPPMSMRDLIDSTRSVEVIPIVETASDGSEIVTYVECTVTS